MPTYPDRRSRYNNVAPWDVSAGTGRAGNTPQVEPKSDLAKRERVPGEHFRDVTATKPPEPSVAIQVDSAVPLQVNDAKVPETVTDAPQPAPMPASIGSVLSEDSVQGSEG